VSFLSIDLRSKDFVVHQEASMGGVDGQVRAADRDKAWERFRDDVRPFLTGRFGLIEEAPVTQEKAYDAMRFDSESGEWILDYCFAK
jgi:hypothetical protein